MLNSKDRNKSNFFYITFELLNAHINYIIAIIVNNILNVRKNIINLIIKISLKIFFVPEKENT